MKTHSLYSKGDHQWIILGRDPDRGAHVADTNQVVLITGDAATLIDPGGIEVFPAFLSSLTGLVAIDKITNLVLTSPDPDCASSVPLWRQVCQNDIVISAPALWGDLIGHLDSECQISSIGDDGGTVSLPDDKILKLIPSHHLHAPAAFSTYDPIAKVLYSGSVGSSLNTANATGEFVVDHFGAHVSFLEDYHGRWFSSERARDDWLAQIADLEIDFLVPHRGPAFGGKDVDSFLDWFATARLGSALRPASPSPVEPTSLPSDQPEISQPNPSDVASSSTKALDEINDILSELSDSPDDKADDTTVGETAEETEPAPPATDNDDFAELLGIEAGPPRGTPEPGAKYRLVTRSDFDGLVCAVVLEQLDMIDDILFVHPNDMQEGRIDITANDITTNLPYVPGCYLSFDHHMSEIKRIGKKHDNHIIIPEAPSAARVVYDYYGGAEGLPNVSTELMDAVDQGDSAQYNMDEVLNPQRWALINFIMDSRTGLGRFRGFRIPNYELMMNLIEYCQDHTIEQILEIEDVKERVEFYEEQAELFKDQVKRCATVHGNLVVLDLLEEETVYVGNRFMIYALVPECNISMHVMWGRDKQNVVFATGKSIFDRSSKTDVGDLMLKYGGGGHHAAGTCQADPLLADTVKSALIQKINQDG